MISRNRPLTNDNVQATLARRLHRSGYAELQDVACHYDVHEREATLRGWVSSFYLKQVAQEIAARTEEVDQVVNLLEVRRNGSQP